MSQFDLTDDQKAIQEAARRFTAEAITPHAARWDEQHHYPKDVVQAAAGLGFGAIYVSEASGGIGLGRLEAALIMEAMAHGCPSTSAFISIHNMAAWMIDCFGAEAVKAKYLPGLVSMDLIASYCLTEPGSGSDAAALKTRAVRDGDHYVVTGSKAFISGGGVNDLYVTMVRTGGDGPKGISCLVIEKDMKGVSFGAQERKLGWRSQPTAQVNFDFQNTQFTLADMATELAAARALLYQAAVKVTDAAPDKTMFAAMAKRLATDTGMAIVDRGLQLFGGYGYLQDFPMEKLFRDLRVHQILEGTNQIMRMITARELYRLSN